MQMFLALVMRHETSCAEHAFVCCGSDLTAIQQKFANIAELPTVLAKVCDIMTIQS